MKANGKINRPEKSQNFFRSHNFFKQNRYKKLIINSFVISASTIIGGVAGATDKTEERPNVLFILTDDQNKDTLGCYAGNKYQTPNIDSLAKNGVKFTNACAVSTLCNPSRYSILTGRYYDNCYSSEFLDKYPKGTASCVGNYYFSLEDDLMNMPAILQKNGYRTGFVGKWHLSDDDLKYDLKDWEKFGLKIKHVGGNPKTDPVANATIKYNHEKWCKRIAQFGFDYVNGVCYRNLDSLLNKHINKHNVEWNVDAVLKFLEETKDSSKPFFLYFATTFPHGPSPYIYSNSLDADPGMTTAGYVKRNYSFMPPRKTFKKETKGHERIGPTAWWDSGVGAILKKLRELGLEKNTIIVYFSDHGAKGGKGTVYENGVCVPLLIQWKKYQKRENRVYSHVVGSIDFAPTILQACGVKVQKNMKIDGISFINVIKGSDRPIRKALLLEMGYAKAIRTDNWKYVAVRYPENIEEQIQAGKKFKVKIDKNLVEELNQPYMMHDHPLISHIASKTYPHYFERDQLYNLKADPEERKNVIDKYPIKAQELKNEMSSVIKEKFPHRPFGEFNKITDQVKQ